MRPKCEVCRKNDMETTCSFCEKSICYSCAKKGTWLGTRYEACPKCYDGLKNKK